MVSITNMPENPHNFLIERPPGLCLTLNCFCYVNMINLNTIPRKQKIVNLWLKTFCAVYCCEFYELSQRNILDCETLNSMATSSFLNHHYGITTD